MGIVITRPARNGASGAKVIKAVTHMIRSTLRRSSHSQHLQCGQTAVPAVATQRPWWLPAAVLAILAAVFSPGLVQAEVIVRVESRPVSSPIKVNVTVTDGTGPVGGLSVDKFTVTLDGNPITFAPADFSLPPAQNPLRNISVVFAMDFSPSTADPAIRKAMQDAVIAFINSMTLGDYAAIVKFNGDRGASVVQTFTLIDGAVGTNALVSAVMAPYDGNYTNLFDGVVVALNQFSPSVMLPNGPKAVVLLSDGLDNKSVATLNSAIDAAGISGIPVFSIALPNALAAGQNALTALAARTAGTYTPTTDTAGVTAAYGTIASLFNNGYLLTFQSAITDCSVHTVLVKVTGQDPAAGTATQFTRCDVAVTPPPPVTPPSSGGGGAFGVTELLAGLLALGARRRRWTLCSGMG